MFTPKLRALELQALGSEDKGHRGLDPWSRVAVHQAPARSPRAHNLRLSIYSVAFPCVRKGEVHSLNNHGTIIQYTPMV